MPVRGEAPDVVRIVEGLRGRVRMRTDITIRFDYGSIVPWVRRVPEGTLAVAGPDALLLASPVELVGENMHTVAEFDVEPGDRVPFVLTWYPVEPRPARARRRRGGARGDRGLLGRLDGPLHGRGRAPRRADPVARHAQGADVRADRRDRRGPDHVAAGVPRRRPELGLPLLLGQGRDADPPLAVRAGYDDEASAWRDWLLRAIAGSPDGPQSLYGLAGERRIAELELPWLEGYEGSRPVRIGNAACTQFQLDVYGEILDALYQARCGGPAAAGRRLGALPPPARAARGRLARARRGDLGGARPASPLHPLEGDGVGRVRPRRPDRRGARSRPGRSSGGSRCATRCTPRCAGRASTRASARSRSRTARTGSTRASCSCRSSASSRSTTRASRPPSPRSSATSRRTGSSSGTARTRRTRTSTASRPARGRSCPARSGSWR